MRNFRVADHFPDGSFLVFMSGGPDSTAAAHDLLVQGLAVLGVHVAYEKGGHAHSTPVHYCALDNVAQWLQERHPGRFEICKTRYPLDGVMTARMIEEENRREQEYLHWGIACDLIAKSLMRAYPRVTRVSYTPPHDDEVILCREVENIYGWLKNFDVMLPSFVREEALLLTKRVIRESMPEELWHLTISCLNPTTYGPCGVCKKCIERAKGGS